MCVHVCVCVCVCVHVICVGWYSGVWLAFVNSVFIDDLTWWLCVGLLEDISGRVLEIGPGPATNFRCLYPPSDITEWVGVEPNNYFMESIEEQKLKYNISFDTSLTWLKGEAIDAEDEGFDAVISTHVLCSVSDVNQVSQRHLCST
mgnify:CR=1 FL=1